MSKPIYIKNDVFIVDIRDGRALFATRYMSMQELHADTSKKGIKTIFCDSPPNKVRQWLKAGYVVAMLEENCPHCTIFTLDKSE